MKPIRFAPTSVLVAVLALLLTAPSHAEDLDDELDSDTQPAAAPAGAGGAVANDPRYVWDLSTLF